MMRILLVLPNTVRFQNGKPIAQFKSRYAYAPTTLTQLAALVPSELNAQVRIIDEGVEVLPAIFEADLIGISVLTPTAPRCYEIAQRAHEQGIPVVMGGYHATLMPEEVQKHADAVVVGYAEQSFPRLLLDFANNQLKPLYHDLSPSVFVTNLPRPRRELLKPRGYWLPNSLEVTRGCPNRCEFCAISTVFEKRYLRRPIEQIVDEIQSLPNGSVVFLDPSPTEDLEYVKGLYEALIPLKRQWMGNTTMKVAQDDEWLDLAARSGCRGLFVGFESVNQQSLSQARKTFNNVGLYREFIHKLHQHDIMVMAGFVFGLDGDTSSVFENTVRFVTDHKVDLVHYNIFTPYPGTQVFTDLERQGRILTHDWSLYDSKHVVFQPSRMSVKQLEYGLQWAWKKTYSIGCIHRRLIRSGSSYLYQGAMNLGMRLLGNTFIPKGFSVRSSALLKE